MRDPHSGPSDPAVTAHPGHRGFLLELLARLLLPLRKWSMHSCPHDHRSASGHAGSRTEAAEVLAVIAVGGGG
jgi:hypothetical protein